MALICATLMTGALGTVTGFQMGLEFLDTLSPEKRFLIGIGMKEAMNDIVLAIMFCLPATLLLAFGGGRARRSEEPMLERDEELDQLPA